MMRTCLSVWLLLVVGTASAADDTGADASLQASLDRAGDNRGQLEQALRDVPSEQRPGMQFLIANMPDRDLRELTGEYLQENVAYAYRAWNESPWREQIPQEIFLNDILPYASINERRDRWRKDLYERCRPLVAGATSPSQAAAWLNQKLFPLVHVRYSTQRPKADQSPYESIQAGLASCSGLSVLLIDACRAVGVPARFVGTPLWSDQSGNHSWVEVWDQGWHFTGAAEPTGDALDRAWFVARASAGQRDHRLHAIYATSFRKTDTHFPLVWAPHRDDVYAVNVTDRYTRAPAEPPHPDAEPVVAAEPSQKAVAELKTYLVQDPAQRRDRNQRPWTSVPLTRADADTARHLLWQDHVQQIRRTRAEEMEAHRLRLGDLEMPFYYKVFGDKPTNGRSLYLSLHGGGGAPREVNDQQWRNQQQLYRPEEGVYVAPRAPTDAWNMWHQAHIDVLFDRLIEDLIVFEDVDPNRVYLLGYSAGGDGVYQLAPRMADRWAAAAMMAGHPNEASPLGLRNVPFALHVGGKDGAYHRNEVAQQWARQLDELQQHDPQGYVHLAKIYPDKSHWLDREDSAALPWMARFTRNPVPTRIVWKQDDVTHTRFYWLAVATDDQHAGAEVTAQRQGQKIDVQVHGIERLSLRLDDRLLDLDQPVVVTAHGQRLFEGRVARTIGVIAQTLEERGDPESVYCSELKVTLPAAGG